jgi:periplasmic divalent cation tolerance protein
MKDDKPPRVLSVVTTVGAMEDARRLADLLLQQRLAACVQVEPGLQSHYVWQGKRCEEAEVRLTIKTLPRLAGRVQALFAGNHPYQLPQFLCTEMEASAAYAAWVSEAVAAPPGPPA